VGRFHGRSRQKLQLLANGQEDGKTQQRQHQEKKPEVRLEVTPPPPETPAESADKARVKTFVRVPEPERRGVKLRQLLDFFMEWCGKCELQDDANGCRMLRCLPDKLTALFEMAVVRGDISDDASLSSTPAPSPGGRSKFGTFDAMLRAEAEAARLSSVEEQGCSDADDALCQAPSVSSTKESPKARAARRLNDTLGSLATNDTRRGRRVNTYAAEELVVKPATRSEGVSAAEKWNPSGLVSRIFVSHAWGDDFADLIQASYAFAAGMWPHESDKTLLDEVTFYIDVFSENRWMQRDAASSPHGDLRATPGNRVLAAASTEFVLLNIGPRARALHRAWCCMELHIADGCGKAVMLNSRYGPLSNVQVVYAQRVLTWSVHLIEKVRFLDVSGAAVSDEAQKTWLQGAFSRAQSRRVATGLCGVAAVNRQLQVLYLDQLVPFISQAGDKESIHSARSTLRRIQVSGLLKATSQKDDGTVSLTFKPGPLGLKVEWPRGVVLVAADGAAACAAGVRPGCRIVKINGQHASGDLLRRYAGGTTSYTVVIQPLEDAAEESGVADDGGAAQSQLLQEWQRCKRLWEIAGQLMEEDPQVQQAAIQDLAPLWDLDARPLAFTILGLLFSETSPAQEAALDFLTGLHTCSSLFPEYRVHTHRALRLDMRHNLTCTDASLRVLAELLPSTLTLLAVDFRSNPHFSDEGLLKLMSGLSQKPLVSLRLCFRSSLHVSDASLTSLGASLPSGLTSLDLDFRNNTKLSSKGFKALVSGLPRQLSHLSLCFAGNFAFSDACLEAMAMHMPPMLSSLSLTFYHHDNGAFSDNGLQMLASALPVSLSELAVSFHGHRDFTDVGLGILAASIPWELTSLTLDFHSSKGFTDAGLQQLALALPTGLRRLDLNFHCSGSFTDVGLMALVTMLPRGLVALHLDLMCNINFTEECVGRLAVALPEGGGLKEFSFSHKMRVQDSVSSMKRRYRYLT